jgi:prefoldin beta subunit
MKGTGEMSPQLQNQILQYQQVQQQLQAVSAQKAQIEAQAKEIDRSLEAINQADDKTQIYRMVGAILIQAKDRAVLVKEITERKETMEIRLHALEKQEKHLKDRFMELHEQLSKIVGAQQGAQGSEDKDE